MNPGKEPRLAPPGGLSNGCGMHIMSPPKQSADGPKYSPPLTSASTNEAGMFNNNRYTRQHCYSNKFQSNWRQSDLHDEVMYMFDKCFHFQKPEDGVGTTWKLPPAESCFSDYYQLDNLQQLKKRLNEVKSQLNDYITEDWARHTHRQDPTADIRVRLKSAIAGEFVTVGWCKLFECLSRFSALAKEPHLNSLHLCEAPGAFISALNYYMHSKYAKEEINWKWLATTLNPYYEGNAIQKMIMDDRFMLYTLDNWLFHKDFTGNIIDRNNLEQLKQQCHERLGEVHLITADGSFDCSFAPDCQEEKVAILHNTEILTALQILAEGGCFVVKVFTLFEALSLSIVYLLNCAFEQVHVFKPCTSRRGNSEVYLVCINYKKDTPNLAQVLEKMKERVYNENVVMGPLFPKSTLPIDFLMKHEIMCRLFMNYQINAIESNISTYKVKLSKFYFNRLQALKRYVSDEYFRRYKVKKLPEELTTMHKCHGFIRKNSREHMFHGSHAERKLMKETPLEEQIFKLRKHVNEFELWLLDPDQRELSFITEFKSGALDDRINLKPYRGQPYEALHSSRFAHAHLLLIGARFNDFHDADFLWLNQPRVEFPDIKFQLNLNDFAETPPGSFYQQQKAFFKALVENILIHKPTRILFTNLAFLTHYAASILRYLSANCFTDLTFKLDNVYEIQLQNATENFQSAVEDLHALLKCADNKEQDVLCFIDILHLHYNDYYNTLCGYNNMLLLHNIKRVLEQ